MKRLNTAFSVAAFAASLFAAGSAAAQAAPPAGGSGGAAGQTPGAAAAGAQAQTPATAKATGTASTSATSTTGSASTAAAGTGAATTAGAGKAGTTTGTATTGTTGTTTTGAPASGAGAAAGTGATTTSASGTSASAGGALDGSTYVVRLRDLEQRIDELKEQIRRSHTRLSLLSDTILSGGVGGARAEIVFKNDLSNAFKLTGLVFVLDGVVQYNRQDDSEAGLLESRKEVPIFSGSIPPGDHTLQLVVRLRGHGYGVFSYLRGYKFDLKSSHSFTVTEGKTVSLETIAWEKGDVTTPLEQRPAIRFDENVRSGMVDAAKPGASRSPVQGGVTQSGSSVSGGISVGTGAK